MYLRGIDRTQDQCGVWETSVYISRRDLFNWTIHFNEVSRGLHDGLDDKTLRFERFYKSAHIRLLDF